MSGKAPRSIGIIMDGNRRWAKAQGLSSLEGHSAGYRKLKEVVGWARDVGVEWITAYAFSTENWKRSPEEVGFLTGLFEQVLTTELAEIEKDGIKLRFIGERARFGIKLETLMKSAEERTKEGKGPTLAIAVSYGGRQELLDATKHLIRSGVSADTLDEKTFTSALYAPDMPEVDLVIRTSGEVRTSNFLPWQAVYAEWFFPKTLWPAFSKEEFTGILEEFGERDRRRGK